MCLSLSLCLCVCVSTASCVLPCLNGGQCVGPYRCRCPQGFTGPRCEQRTYTLCSEAPFTSAVATRPVPDVQFRSVHVGRSYLNLSLSSPLNVTLTLTLTPTLLTILNPTNRNGISKTIKTHQFSTNKSTTPWQRRHVSEYVAVA